MPSSPAWPKSAEEILRRVWGDQNGTGMDCVRALADAGFIYTRNACIGKARRLKLGPKRAPGKPKLHISKRKYQQAKHESLVLVESLPPPLFTTPYEVHDPLPVPLAEDLRGCKYIAGEPSDPYCGEDTIDGVWCEEHRKLVYLDKAALKAMRAAK